ncbi:hypothetical protein [Vreelandella maris]|uniref:Uncharacterized protein n=1 Tax=Vreelandella maris TaxID=2729617 RepID=A0A7Y6RFX6_9GAMM|nr:hypothetical protein [Halomonas maris]NVF16218.1 hypothetical protein [Halomonas maris]
MTYAYGMKGAPAVGNGLGGLPRRTESMMEDTSIFSVSNFFTSIFSVSGSAGTPIVINTPALDLSKTLIYFNQRVSDGSSSAYSAQLTDIGEGFIEFTPRISGADLDIINLVMLQLNGVKKVHNFIGRQNYRAYEYIPRDDFKSSLIPFVSTHYRPAYYGFDNNGDWGFYEVYDDVNNSESRVRIERNFAGTFNPSESASYLLSVVELLS